MRAPSCLDLRVCRKRPPVPRAHALRARRAAARKMLIRRKSHVQCMRRCEKQGAAKETMGALLNALGTHADLRGPAYKAADLESCGLLVSYRPLAVFDRARTRSPENRTRPLQGVVSDRSQARLASTKASPNKLCDPACLGAAKRAAGQTGASIASQRSPFRWNTGLHNAKRPADAAAAPYTALQEI